VADLVSDLGWILDALPVAVWVGRVPDGAAAYVNKEFERVMLMPAVASAGIEEAPKAYGICTRDGKPYPVDQLPFSRVLAERVSVVIDDIVLQRPSGNLDIRAFGSPVHDSAGNITHVIVAFFDIRAEMLARRERQIAEQRLGLVCNNAPIALWATDLEGTVTLSEGAGLATLGVKPGQLVGQNLFDLYADHPTIPGYIRRALAGEAVWYPVADGGAIFDSYLTPLRDESGKMVGLAGFSNDVTQVRTLQNTVIQNDRINAMGTLAASVAHEINNPLTYVLPHAEEVRAELDMLEGLLAGAEGTQLPAIRASLQRVRDEFSPVLSGIERIANITRDLRTFNRADGTSAAPTDVRAVIDSVIKLVRKEVETRSTLVLDLQDTPNAMANETRLAQVVLNLIMNAMQALPLDDAANNRVVVRSYADGAWVVIEVSDTGPGIRTEDRERLFDPFFTTKEIGKGTGLGLFVCRNIVRGFSGDVVVADAPEGGALLRVTLPRGPSAPAVMATPRPSMASMVGRSVVVIDDDATVRHVLEAQLTRAGFRVTTFDDGALALQSLPSQTSVDLVFCDLMMKGMTGMELGAALTRSAPELARKLVFMTGGAFSAQAQDFVAKHADRTVNKPFDIVAEARRRLT